MNPIADYKVVRDGTFDLDEGEERELSFDVSPDVLAAEPLIVAYKVRPVSIEQDENDFVELSLSLAFHGEIDRVTLRENTVHGLWEVFPHTMTSAILEEALVFHCHHGRVRISDVIVWFQRKD